jgi:hypothetical protein
MINSTSGGRYQKPNGFRGPQEKSLKIGFFLTARIGAETISFVAMMQVCAS